MARRLPVHPTPAAPAAPARPGVGAELDLVPW